MVTLKRNKKHKLQKTIKPMSWLLVLALSASLLSGCSAGVKPENHTSAEPEYAEKLFGTELIDIEILADEAQWQSMLDNAEDEAYIKIDVKVNGSIFKDVGIRPKGNSSLTQVAASNSDRYSFRLKFDEYIEGQTCFGLESFVLNNMLGDNSYMKEYLSYDLMKTAGVEAPYFGFTNIVVNGKAWGLYLAVELYNDSYEQRVFNDTKGMLYNVKMNMDAAKGKPVGERPGEAIGAGSTGGSLKYTDDNPASYSAIFENAVGKSTIADYQKVIQALKALSQGNSLESYFDVDAILRYLAAHTIVVNLDSYSSNMAQNYYLYERDGKITLLPWDYNLSWGGFQSKDATAVVNFPIDTPVSGIALSERPLIEKLFANSAYLERYHQYLQSLLDDYFAQGKFKAKINALNDLIAESVKDDPSAFCSFEAYQKAVVTLTTLGELRAQSVQGQLNGTVPATSETQKSTVSQLIKADSIELNDLGSMMNGKGALLGPGGFDAKLPPGFANIDKTSLDAALKLLESSNGQLTTSLKEQLSALGLTDDQINQLLMFSQNKGLPAPGGSPHP